MKAEWVCWLVLLVGRVSCLQAADGRCLGPVFPLLNIFRVSVCFCADRARKHTLERRAGRARIHAINVGGEISARLKVGQRAHERETLAMHVTTTCKCMQPLVIYIKAANCAPFGCSAQRVPQNPFKNQYLLHKNISVPTLPCGVHACVHSCLLLNARLSAARRANEPCCAPAQCASRQVCSAYMPRNVDTLTA